MARLAVFAVFVVLFSSSMFGCVQQSKKNSSVKIVGGSEVTDASEATMKSTVALHLGGSLCTGTLIGPNQILSAAHCIKEGSQIQIGYGPTGRVVSGLRVIMARKHPRWTRGPNDVSIVIFEGTLPNKD